MPTCSLLIDDNVSPYFDDLVASVKSARFQEF